GPPPPGATARWKTALAVLTFVMVKGRETFGLASPAAKLSEVGKAAAVPRRAALRFRIPAPVSCTVPDQAPAVLISRDRYWAPVSPGRAALRTAAAPASSGEEKLVPCVSV